MLGGEEEEEEEREKEAMANGTDHFFFTLLSRPVFLFFDRPPLLLQNMSTLTWPSQRARHDNKRAKSSSIHACLAGARLRLHPHPGRPRLKC